MSLFGGLLRRERRGQDVDGETAFFVGGRVGVFVGCGGGVGGFAILFGGLLLLGLGFVVGHDVYDVMAGDGWRLTELSAMTGENYGVI